MVQAAWWSKPNGSVDRVRSYSVPLWWSKVQIPINSTCSIIILSNVIFLVNNLRNTVWVKFLCILPLFYLIELTRSWPMRVGTLFKWLGHCDQNRQSFKIFPEILIFFLWQHRTRQKISIKNEKLFFAFLSLKIFFSFWAFSTQNRIWREKKNFWISGKGLKERTLCVSSGQIISWDVN